MNKVLFVASVVKKHINVFHLPYLKWFQDKGYETHVCASNDFQEVEDLSIPFCDTYHDIPFNRNPFNLRNLIAMYQLRKVILKHEYDIIHCHTPIGGALTRLCTLGLKNMRPKIIYTAHGFHFFQGSSVINWIFYYPVEKWLSNFTDLIITINKEDYKNAKRFNTCRVEFIPGVGIESEKYSKISNLESNKNKLNENIAGKFVILSVGELNSNKNHSTIIKALSKIDDDNILYLICGEGKMKNRINSLIEELGLVGKVKLLGFQSDLTGIYSSADLFVFPSKREGLSVSLMEAMSAGLPVIASNVRGNIDLIEDGVGGYLVNPTDVEAFELSLEKLINDKKTRDFMSKNNKDKIKQYDKGQVVSQMAKLYESLMERDSSK